MDPGHMRCDLLKRRRILWLSVVKPNTVRSHGSDWVLLALIWQKKPSSPLPKTRNICLLSPLRDCKLTRSHLELFLSSDHNLPCSDRIWKTTKLCCWCLNLSLNLQKEKKICICAADSGTKLPRCY